MYVFFFILAAILCGIFSTILAKAKERNALGWFIVGFLFGIFGLILIAGLPPMKVIKDDNGYWNKGN